MPGYALTAPLLPAPAPRLPRFDLRQARAFVCVADELHFSRAAARLYTSQSALSRAIRGLEGIVGVPLLERTTRRVRLTAAGESFADECRKALAHFDRAAGSALDAADGRTGRLRIAYMDFAINGRLPLLLKEFRARFPRSVLDLEYLPSAKQRTALFEGRIDIGMMIGELEGAKARNLLVDQDDFVALLPEGHPIASRRTVALADLAREPFVLGNDDGFSSFRRLFLPLCHEAGFMPDIVQQASNSSGIFGMVAAGVGVSVYAGCARNVRRAGVVVRPLADVRATIPVFAAWVDEPASELLAKFTDFLVSQARLGFVPPAR